MQFGAWPGLKATLLAQALRRRAGVTAMAGVAPQLAADGAGAAALKAGYGPEAPALLAQRCQRHSVFWLQVFVSRSHLRTLPSVRVLHFRFETAPRFSQGFRQVGVIILLLLKQTHGCVETEFAARFRLAGAGCLAGIRADEMVNCRLLLPTT